VVFEFIVTSNKFVESLTLLLFPSNTMDTKVISDAQMVESQVEELFPARDNTLSLRRKQVHRSLDKAGKANGDVDTTTHKEFHQI
jgi:hypothetical protein